MEHKPDMTPGAQLLEGAAVDGSLDPNEWPRVLEAIISRLHHTVHNEFPIPTTPPSPPPSPPSPMAETIARIDPLSSQETQSADKENAPPPATPTRPPVPPFSQSTPTHAGNGTSAPDSPATIPLDLLALHQFISSTLTKNFPSHPPHTLQRLAELILRPKAHYRYLPSYLHALDRVISVSSPTTIFPLPLAVLPATSGGGLLNGTATAAAAAAAHSSSVAAGLGSDESLGGALLTPIPWLRPERGAQAAAPPLSELKSESSEMVDGPNGAGRIETVSVVNGALAPAAGSGAVAATSAGSSSSSSGGSSSSGSGSGGGSAHMTEEALREAGAVTQGELLRQEQEAGVVPITQTGPRRGLLGSLSHGGAGGAAAAVAAAAAAAEGPGVAEERAEEHPHARGPEEIGMEDIGTQERALGGALDLEAAVGRPAVRPEGDAEEVPVAGREVDVGEAPAAEDVAARGRGEQEGTGEGGPATAAGGRGVQAHADTVIVDADGKTEEEAARMAVGGDNTMPDAVDATAQ